MPKYPVAYRRRVAGRPQRGSRPLPRAANDNRMGLVRLPRDMKIGKTKPLHAPLRFAQEWYHRANDASWANHSREVAAAWTASWDYICTTPNSFCSNNQGSTPPNRQRSYDGSRGTCYQLCSQSAATVAMGTTVDASHDVLFLVKRFTVGTSTRWNTHAVFSRKSGVTGALVPPPYPFPATETEVFPIPLPAPSPLPNEVPGVPTLPEPQPVPQPFRKPRPEEQPSRNPGRRARPKPIRFPNTFPAPIVIPPPGETPVWPDIAWTEYPSRDAPPRTGHTPMPRTTPASPFGGYPKPPDENTKENKVTVRTASAAAWAVANGAWGAQEMVANAHGQLPEHYQVKGGTPYDQAKAVWEHSDQLDWADVMEITINDWLEDAYYGGIGKAAGRVNRATGQATGAGRAVTKHPRTEDDQGPPIPEIDIDGNGNVRVRFGKTGKWRKTPVKLPDRPVHND